MITIDQSEHKVVITTESIRSPWRDYNQSIDQSEQSDTHQTINQNTKIDYYQSMKTPRSLLSIKKITKQWLLSIPNQSDHHDAITTNQPIRTLRDNHPSIRIRTPRWQEFLTINQSQHQVVTTINVNQSHN